jgi:gamma-glutamyltranspeptidase/glutathione hydrolase
VIPNASLIGHLAVGVPGSVAGLEYARAKYGTLPREPLIAPAIALAEEGFVCSRATCTCSPKRRRICATIRPAPRSSSTREIRAPRGSRLVQRDLAQHACAKSHAAARRFLPGRSLN